MKKVLFDSARSFVSAFVALAIVLFLATFVSAWEGPPPGAAPSTNPAYPLNESAGSQTKEGSLTIGLGLASVVIDNGGVAANQFCLGGDCKSDWDDIAAGISCNWAGWKGAMTFVVNDGSKYPDSYWTTILNCVGGNVTEILYLSCTAANTTPYNAGVDCSN